MSWETNSDGRRLSRVGQIRRGRKIVGTNGDAVPLMKKRPSQHWRRRRRSTSRSDISFDHGARRLFNKINTSKIPAPPPLTSAAKPARAPAVGPCATGRTSRPHQKQPRPQTRSEVPNIQPPGNPPPPPWHRQTEPGGCTSLRDFARFRVISRDVFSPPAVLAIAATAGQSPTHDLPQNIIPMSRLSIRQRHHPSFRSLVSTLSAHRHFRGWRPRLDSSTIPPRYD